VVGSCLDSIKVDGIVASIAAAAADYESVVKLVMACLPPCYKKYSLVIRVKDLLQTEAPVGP
jgi:hypothetical protein